MCPSRSSASRHALALRLASFCALRADLRGCRVACASAALSSTACAAAHVRTVCPPATALGDPPILTPAPLSSTCSRCRRHRDAARRSSCDRVTLAPRACWGAGSRHGIHIGVAGGGGSRTGIQLARGRCVSRSARLYAVCVMSRGWCAAGGGSCGGNHRLGRDSFVGTLISSPSVPRSTEAFAWLPAHRSFAVRTLPLGST